MSLILRYAYKDIPKVEMSPILIFCHVPCGTHF